MNGGKNGAPEKLASCYQKSLQLAVDNGCKTIAFPNISTGIYGYPKAAAATIAYTTVSHFLQTDSSTETVLFVCFDAENYQLYKDLQLKHQY